MSRKRDCCDNAVAESFWTTLRAELIHDMDFPTRTAAQHAIFECSKCSTIDDDGTRRLATEHQHSMRKSTRQHRSPRNATVHGQEPAQTS